MIIKFQYGDFSEICDKYEDLFEYSKGEETRSQKGVSFIILSPRVVIPQLHLSFRKASCFLRNKAVKDSRSEDAWEGVGEAFVLYPENEKNINKFITFGMEDLYYALNAQNEETKSAMLSDIEVDKLACYINTEEFIDEETAKTISENAPTE